MDSNEVLGCRLCGGALESFIDFGDVPVANAFLEEGDAPTFPLHVGVCVTCSEHQLMHDFNPKEVFGGEYLYETSKGLKEHFEKYAREVSNSLGLGEFDKVLEIGGNSGILCKAFKNLGLEATNVEPARNIAEISVANGVKTYNNFFNKEFVDSYLNTNPKVKLVVANNVLAHIPDFNGIIDAVCEILEDDGTLVFENAYWYDTLKNKDLGQVYLEHIFYHSVGSLFRYFHLRGMTLYHVEFNDIQCGSCRFFVSKNGSTKMGISVLEAICNEILYSKEDEYKNFSQSVSKLCEDIGYYVKENGGKKIALVGVPAKAALLINRCGLEDSFFAAFDDAPLKWGKKVPGTNTIIRPMKELKDSGADIAFIGAYNFKDLIIKNNSDFIGRWFCPIPEPKESIRLGKITSDISEFEKSLNSPNIRITGR